MSVNTIAISPSGARAFAAVVVAAAAWADALEDDEPFDEPRVEGSVHELLGLCLSVFVFAPLSLDDDVREVNDIPVPEFESPCMADSLVMISRNVGRMEGS
jgi:hypothetical protein